MRIGKGIRLARAASKITLRDLAARTGISTSHLSLIEANKRDPSLDLLAKIANGLNVPPTILVFLGSESGELNGIDPETSMLIRDAAMKLLSSLEEVQNGSD